MEPLNALETAAAAIFDAWAAKHGIVPEYKVTPVPRSKAHPKERRTNVTLTIPGCEIWADGEMEHTHPEVGCDCETVPFTERELKLCQEILKATFSDWVAQSDFSHFVYQGRTIDTTHTTWVAEQSARIQAPTPSPEEGMTSEMELV